MKRVVVPVAVAAVLATSSIALAASQTEGRVKNYNMTGHQLTLEDGTLFYLPNNFSNDNIKAGTHVQITWEMQNGKHMASAVTLVN